MTEQLLLIEGVNKEFPGVKALSNMHLNLNAGEVHAVIGENGAGKSTMMKIITCFIPPNSGSVNVCGFDVMEQSLAVRRLVGYLPEHNPLYLDMYVREYLDFIAGLHHIKLGKDKKISDMIEATGLTAEQHKKIGALSKGYRQRVGLAQAMIHDPQVLILDEPTSGLDPNQLVDIRNLIRVMGKEKTVLLSTHIMQEVEALCDRVIIINKGRIVANDSTAVLQQQSGKTITITVEFDRSVSRQQLARINGVKNMSSANPTTWQLTAEKGIDIRPLIFQFAVDEKLTVLSMSKAEQSLEGVFQELTKS